MSIEKKSCIKLSDDKYFLKIKNIILRCFNDEVRIILFGSRANLSYQENSDYDISVISKRPDCSNEIAIAKDMIEESNIPFKVDIIDFNKASKKLKGQILQDGIEWKD